MNVNKLDRLCERLADCLGKENVARESSVLEQYSFDGLRPYRGYRLPSHGFPPDCVVTPRSTEDVVKLVNIAAEFGVPVVSYGAGTGLMGGALAVNGGILVEFKMMNRILRIEETDQLVEVQPGASLKSLDEALRQKGFVLGHDPWTKDYATVGGSISTNGMGYLGGKYGCMGDQVLGLQVVLPDGTIIKTSAAPNSSTGLDLKRLFIGTEGTLGIITEATLRCYPSPEVERVYAYTFPSFEKAYSAVLDMRRLGLTPTSLEAGGSDPDGPAYLYMVLTGFVEEVETWEATSHRALSSHGGTKLEEKEAKSYWENRHEVAHRYMRRVCESPLALWREERSFDFLHVALPVSQTLLYWRKCLAIIRKYGLKVDDYGIWIKPELFSIAFSREGIVPAENLEGAVEEGLLLAIKMRGSLEYCHGVGIRLARFMSIQDATGLNVIKRLKEAIDSSNILNPGKLGL